MRLPPGGAQEQPALFDILRVEMFGVCPKSQNKSTPQSACFTEREFWPIWVLGQLEFSMASLACSVCNRSIPVRANARQQVGGGRGRGG